MNEKDYNRNISIDDFDYQLSDERIAYYPAKHRDGSKLLVFKSKEHEIIDSEFRYLPNFLEKNDILVFNDSKVIHARLLVHNDTGAAIEIFCLEPLQPSDDPAIAFALTKNVTWKCMVGNAKKWKRPLTINVQLENKILKVRAERGEAENATFEVTFTWDDDSVTFAEWIECYGKIPLPPYIHRTTEEIDTERYQTVYAHYDGSVAAPTAGLHFTKELIENLKNSGVSLHYVTLHVGAGTFKPVTSASIGEHFMHDEKIFITKSFLKYLLSNIDNRIVAVGTTVTRTLESMFIIGAKLFLNLDNPFEVQQWEFYDNSELREITKKQSFSAIMNYLEQNNADTIIASTKLIILPTYQRKVVGGIITNFHQPKSTLLLLISNFVGENWRNIYTYAMNNDYRFLSYGDANLYL